MARLAPYAYATTIPVAKTLCPIVIHFAEIEIDEALRF